MDPPKLAAGIRKILDVPEVQENRRADAAADAWDAFREPVKAARNNKALLDDVAEPDMIKVLDFVRRRGSERKVQSKQAKECIKILIENDGWHRAAHRDAQLYEQLREFLAELPDAKARLEMPAAELQPAPAPVEPKRTRAELAQEEPGVKRLLQSGTDIMRTLDWEFPRDWTSNKLDKATEGCRALYEAMNRLSAACRIGSDGRGDVCAGEELLAELTYIDWPRVLRFLRSMYESGLRNTWRARIEFLAGRLEIFSPAFRAAVAEREPPWRCAGAGGAATIAAAAERAAEEAAAVEAAESRVFCYKGDTGFVQYSAEDQKVLREAAFSKPRPSEVPLQGGKYAVQVFDRLEDGLTVQVNAQTGFVRPVKLVERGSINAAGVEDADLDAEEVKLRAQRPSLQLEQYGHFAICNGTKEELTFTVEQTKEQFKLRTGATQSFAAETPCVDVQINRSGMFAFARGHLARQALVHQNYYHVHCNPNGGVVCTPVV